MRFADPQACPDCRGVIAGQSTCPHCGLDLTSHEVRQLWQTLLQADELLAAAVQRRDTPPAPARPTEGPKGEETKGEAAQPTTSAAAEPKTAAYPSYAAQPQHPPRKERTWNAGTILLVLGAFGLIVAGLIFVTRSWEDIGLFGKTLVLLGITALICALGVWVTRRPLRASAEAVWTVFLALLTLDFFAARHEGLAGLDSIGIEWAWVVWGVISLGLGVGIAVWAREHVQAELIAPAIAGGLGITIAGIGAGAVLDEIDFAWRAVIALVVTGVLALSTRPAGLKPMTLVARIVFGGFFAAAYVAAFIELVDNPTLREMLQDGHGHPMLIMAIASLVVAWLVAPLRIPAVALAVVAVCALVITPAADAWQPEGVWLSVAALAVVLAIGASQGTNNWVRGARVGAVPVIGGLFALHVGLLGEVIETLDPILNDPWSKSWDTRLDVTSVENVAIWPVPVVLVAFAVVVWFVTRWPELDDFRAHATTAVAAAVALIAIDATVAMRLPVWAAAALLLVVASGLLAAQRRGLTTYAGPVAAVVIAAASGLTAASHGVSAVTWIVGAAILVGLALAQGADLLRQAYAALAVLLGLAGLGALVELLDLDESVTPMAVLVAALAILATAGLRLRSHVMRVALEGSAALGGFVALVSTAGSTELAIRWTVAGVGLIALAAGLRDRRWYVWPGAIALVVAYILLIVDSGFSFVEAYTLPLGAVGLAAGAFAARRMPEVNTWTVLGPGLAIALLPSVPQALADPTELRALLLGLGAVVALLAGIKLGWQAPFVSGVVIATLIVLFNIGPYANAAPRVVVIAVASSVLLGVGITWEDRVRDGRKLVGYVRSMR